MEQSQLVLDRLTANADHVDSKTITSHASLREFLSGLFSYMPFWLRGLYRVRGVFVRVLGMKQENAPTSVEIDPAAISFEPGDGASFFKVIEAKEEEYYFAGANESHLNAILGVMAREREVGTEYTVVTIVHYNSWTGPLYFNVIRPFHHLVVMAMMRSAAAR